MPTGPLLVGTLVNGVCQAQGTGFTLTNPAPIQVDIKGTIQVDIVGLVQIDIPHDAFLVSNEPQGNCRL